MGQTSCRFRPAVRPVWLGQWSKLGWLARNSAIFTYPNYSRLDSTGSDRFNTHLSTTGDSAYNAQVAQSVEQGTENPRVGSSILSLGTI